MAVPRIITIAVRGASGVGKTCLVDMYNSIEFHEEHVRTEITTIKDLFRAGVDRDVLFRFVDISHHEEPDIPVDACILMYDLTREDTYTQLRNYNPYSDNFPVIICGNKSDLEQELPPLVPEGGYIISVRNYEGLENLLRVIGRKILGNDYDFL